MVERVSRHRDKRPLFEQYGVEEAIRSTLSRRVDLPSGGYLVFDYAEAFTVIDVNTGRFVGSRSKSSGARLEDTITANNLEAVKEVVHQLRLRDIGGIIVIDFIDMANPKNRATVEEALKKELERDRTKTYVVEISPLGLVEMTRQNVTEGPREILTQKCPTCTGDGIVLSADSAAVDAERRLRTLAAGAKRGVEAFRVELHEAVAAHLVGPGASRLTAIEELAKRRFFLEGRGGVGLDRFKVLGEGKLADLAPEAPVSEGEEIRVELVEVGLHDVGAAMAKLDGLPVCVANAAKLVGKKAKVRIERVLDGTAYATLVTPASAKDAEPITAEAEAEKPTRAPRKKPADEKPKAEAVPEPEEPEPQAVEEPAVAKPKKKTRRGSRGGRGRKRKTPGAAAAATPNGEGETPAVATIHMPDPDLGQADGDNTVPSSADGAEPAKPKKRTRRGSRGGRNRRKKTPAAETKDGS
jgi:ribonuclease G